MVFVWLLAVQEVEGSRQATLVLDRLEALFFMGGPTVPGAGSSPGVKEPAPIASEHNILQKSYLEGGP